MSPASSDASMLTVAVPAPLRPTLLVVDSCTRQHANLLVPEQIVSGLVQIWIRSKQDSKENLLWLSLEQKKHQTVYEFMATTLCVIFSIFFVTFFVS
jgi:hypothetical protein